MSFVAAYNKIIITYAITNPQYICVFHKFVQPYVKHRNTEKIFERKHSPSERECEKLVKEFFSPFFENSLHLKHYHEYDRNIIRASNYSLNAMGVVCKNYTHFVLFHF